jgi:pimeloyl-ACP methyl ester carboxylesterase
MPGERITPGPIVIGWGRNDRVCLPCQAARALRRFRSARLHLSERCGHFPQVGCVGRNGALVLETAGDRA